MTTPRLINILLVDDQPANLICLETILDGLNYTTRGLVYYLRCGEQLEIPS